jgi:hypothetical protein
VYLFIHSVSDTIFAMLFLPKPPADHCGQPVVHGPQFKKQCCRSSADLLDYCTVWLYASVPLNEHADALPECWHTANLCNNPEDHHLSPVDLFMYGHYKSQVQQRGGVPQRPLATSAKCSTKYTWDTRNTGTSVGIPYAR